MPEDYRSISMLGSSIQVVMEKYSVEFAEALLYLYEANENCRYLADSIPDFQPLYDFVMTGCFQGGAHDQTNSH